MNECLLCGGEINEDKIRCEQCEREFKQKRKYEWIIFIVILSSIIFSAVLYSYNSPFGLYLSVVLPALSIIIYYCSKNSELRKSKNERKLNNYFFKIEKEYLSHLTEKELSHYHNKNYDFIRKL